MLAAALAAATAAALLLARRSARARDPVTVLRPPLAAPRPIG
jgi:hypothetical protein